MIIYLSMDEGFAFLAKDGSWTILWFGRSRFVGMGAKARVGEASSATTTTAASSEAIIVLVILVFIVLYCLLLLS